MSRNKVYDFAEQEILGKQGEKILDKWLESIYSILDVSSVEKYQKLGIDRIIIRPDGTMITVDYKFDLASVG